MGRELRPATPEAVAVVEQELRRTWWPSTVAMGVPLVIGVLLTAVVVAEVVDGDLLALLFPGLVAVLALWWGGRLVAAAIATKRREARLGDEERRQAVYVRGLAGTTRLAAAQDPEAMGVLRRLWSAEQGRVAAVSQDRRAGGRVSARLTVALRDGITEDALVTAPGDHLPGVGRRVRVLVDPHAHRAVVDLRRPRRGDGTAHDDEGVTR